MEYLNGYFYLRSNKQTSSMNRSERNVSGTSKWRRHYSLLAQRQLAHQVIKQNFNRLGNISIYFYQSNSLKFCTLKSSSRIMHDQIVGLSRVMAEMIIDCALATSIRRQQHFNWLLNTRCGKKLEKEISLRYNNALHSEFKFRCCGPSKHTLANIPVQSGDATYIAASVSNHAKISMGGGDLQDHQKENRKSSKNCNPPLQNQF